MVLEWNILNRLNWILQTVGQKRETAKPAYRAETFTEYLDITT